MNLPKYLIFFSLFHYLIINSADSKCPESFECGSFGSLEFPLSDSKNPGCGLFMVDGCVSGNPKIQFEAKGYWYDILEKKSPNKFLVRDSIRQYHLNNNSCFSFKNLSLPQSPSSSFTFSPNLTLFACTNHSSNEGVQDYFKNYDHTTCPLLTVYYRNRATDVPVARESSIPPECSVIQLPLESNQDSGDPFNLLTAEFTLEWNVSEACYKCQHGGGQCLSNSRNEFICKKGNRTFKKVFLIGGVTMTALTFTSIIFFLLIRREYRLLKLLGLQKAKKGKEQDIELFLKDHGNLAPSRYKYSDLKKMTKSFSVNLGKGGYGSVYKGKLLDGRLVAVKMLNESKGNGEEFMNEVASISRTSHINIVTLLGFCFEGSKRALIYDFMPNGSLEKFIHNTASSLAEGGLGWQKLFEIALGIARGLQYLHQGCNTRILHFDIKPHNILLDKDFNPKISDFGLAKLCPNRSSIVSMLVARGTIGYIAPEVFCRNFGEVSHKSDVYSYGMMVLEIAGGRKNIDPRDVDQTSEIYFPQYIYKQLEMDAERGASLDGIVNDNESQFAKRKLIIVGLWCIQTDPKDRPSMSKVVEMLEGKLESLQVPPKPYLSSPPRSAPNFSTSESL
ncbi:hypothetical protein Pfo_023723 [Paulownia fortunei]|nr:hypothetical protein Pfo_023723 [Paulownia fortunei]